MFDFIGHLSLVLKRQLQPRGDDRTRLEEKNESMNILSLKRG